MARQSLTVNIHVFGAQATLRAFSKLPKEANDELRDTSLRLSRDVAVDIAGAARARGEQAALLAPTVKAVRDRVPAVAAGGTTKVGRHHVSAWRLLFASEFGQDIRSGWYHAAKYDGSTGLQYPPHLGRGSYWFYKTVEANEQDIARSWTRAADAIIRAWGRDL